MYRHHHKGEAVLQTIDFSTLKKPITTPVCKLDQNSLQFVNAPNPTLLLLGAFAIVHETVDITDAQFTEFPFESVPRQFQQFSHEKTASEILNILRKQGKSIQTMVQLLNSYPILVHVLESWVRKKALGWLEGNTAVDCMGNEHELLIDLTTDIRGSLLAIIANSLKICLKIKFEIFPTLETTESEEELGQPARWELQVIFRPDNVVSGTLYEKEGESTSISNIPSKASQCGFLRRSKMADNETEVRSGAEFKSVKKERGAFCEKCGIGRRCECNQIKRKGFGYGITPKNNQLSTSTNGIKSQPFSIGFLNEHNISKIRESNPGQK